VSEEIRDFNARKYTRTLGELIHEARPGVDLWEMDVDAIRWALAEIDRLKAEVESLGLRLRDAREERDKTMEVVKSLKAEVADLRSRCEAHEAARGRCRAGSEPGGGLGVDRHHAAHETANEIQWQRQHIASLMELIETLATEGKKS
jgi:chromosome segregation ATPase